MKKMILTTLVSLALLCATAEARRDNKREVSQQARIGQGVQSGELTHREARKLRKGQKRIDRLQQQAKADGTVSPEEKLKIEKAQDRQNALIYKQKHDAQERGSADGAPVAQPSPAAPVVTEPVTQ
ncbi:MAG: hypothetical protein K2P92_07080 [Bdellovibrionaceae bacterium]|nr:hypothetical protein [Pseudobdellovibrionaceae bacterium]